MSETVTVALIASIAPALFFLYTVARDWWDRQVHLKINAIYTDHTLFVICTNVGKYPVGVGRPTITKPLREGHLPYVPWIGTVYSDSPFVTLAPSESKQVSCLDAAIKEVSVTTHSGMTKKARVKKH